MVAMHSQRHIRWATATPCGVAMVISALKCQICLTCRRFTHRSQRRNTTSCSKRSLICPSTIWDPRVNQHTSQLRHLAVPSTRRWKMDWTLLNKSARTAINTELKSPQTSGSTRWMIVVSLVIRFGRLTSEAACSREISKHSSVQTAIDEQINAFASLHFSK